MRFSPVRYEKLLCQRGGIFFGLGSNRVVDPELAESCSSFSTNQILSGI